MPALRVRPTHPSPVLDMPRPRQAKGVGAAGRGRLDAEAACIGTDPLLFDAKSYATAGPALAVCGRCPVKVECLAVVAPQGNEFDGVCAGEVWRAGRRVRPPKRWEKEQG